VQRRAWSAASDADHAAQCAAESAWAGAGAGASPRCHGDPDRSDFVVPRSRRVNRTSPSLGTFINEGNKQLFSGAWVAW